MKTYGDFKRLCDAIKFPGLELEVYETRHTVDPQVNVGHLSWHLRWECRGGPMAVDNTTGKAHAWNGRPWRLSTHMTDGEVVQTAWAALMMVLEHEARERFTFHGTTIFNPHLDIWALRNFVQQGHMEERDKPA
jgi:hypothetical protein